MTQYVAELETPRGGQPPDPGRSGGLRRAGGVMAVLIKAGRLELVPPAAPGFSPVANEKR